MKKLNEVAIFESFRIHPSENEKIASSLSERVVAVTPAQAGLLNDAINESPIEERPEEIAGSLVE